MWYMITMLGCLLIEYKIISSVGVLLIKTIFETFYLRKYNPTLSLTTLVGYSLLVSLDAIKNMVITIVLFFYFIKAVIPPADGFIMLAYAPFIFLGFFLLLYIYNKKAGVLISKTTYRKIPIKNYNKVCDALFSGIALLMGIMLALTSVYFMIIKR